MNLRDLSIDAHWTLFLDRDGVINRKLPGDYVKRWEEFEFLPGVIQSLIMLRSIFGRIIIVTNQQGIGKGLMTEDDLTGVHTLMQKELSRYNVTIDKIYHSPHLETKGHPMRKPNPGMAHLAVKEVPGVDLSRAIMVGDSISDIEFGKNAGIRTALLTSEAAEQAATTADLSYPDLLAFANDLKSSLKQG